MQNAVLLALALFAILLSAALLVVWSRRVNWVRPLAIPLALAAASISAGIIGSTLGHAVPLIAGVTAPAGEVTLLSAKLIEGDGIYVTLDSPGAPRLYWLPWSKEMAEKLEEMLSNPDSAGVMTTIPPFEWSWDLNEPSFQEMPQPKVMPDKPPEAPQAPHFSA